MNDVTARPLPGLRWLREPVNALTHAAGVVLGLVGLGVLLSMAAGNVLHVVSATVYGLSVVVLFLASTLLHALKVKHATYVKLRLFDHAAIFVLIAGTYTPVLLVTVLPAAPSLAIALLSVVWALALLGVLFKIFWLNAPRWFSTSLYVILGWLSVLALGPLVQTLPWPGVTWLVAGGVTYTVGAVVYALKRPNPFPRVFGYHEIWHLFVLAGSAFHFVLIARYIIGA
jgi:hemolysin III